MVHTLVVHGTCQILYRQVVIRQYLTEIINKNIRIQTLSKSYYYHITLILLEKLSRNLQLQQNERKESELKKRFHIVLFLRKFS